MSKNLSLNGEGLEMHQVNMETTAGWSSTFAAVSAVIILVVNIPILREIKLEKNYTFINILVGLDCIDSLAHIPVLASISRYGKLLKLSEFEDGKAKEIFINKGSRVRE